MSLYVFLKEIWENTIHHARQPTTSLRYMKVSRVIYNSLTEIKNAGLPSALDAYLKARSQKDGAKKYLIIDIVDSGYGIYESLKDTLPWLNKSEVVERAFYQHSTSKIQRKPIRRGLGLFAAMECAQKLKGMVVITTSGVLCANYDYHSDTFLNNIKVLSSKDEADMLSTSISLIMPV
ncbi:hypothetical protein D9M69_542510 [compost metagenome]